MRDPGLVRYLERHGALSMLPRLRLAGRCWCCGALIGLSRGGVQVVLGFTDRMYSLYVCHSAYCRARADRADGFRIAESFHVKAG